MADTRTIAERLAAGDPEALAHSRKVWRSCAYREQKRAERAEARLAELERATAAFRAERDEAVARLRAYWAWHDGHGSGHESVVPGYAASEHYTTEEALELERLHDGTGAWLARAEEGGEDG